MWPRRLANVATLVALAAWLAPAPVAEARPAKTTKTSTAERAKTSKRATSTKRAKPAKRTKTTRRATKKRGRGKVARRYARRAATRHSTDAVAAPHGARTPGSNMPDGWSWPPNDAMIAAGQACTARLDELGVEWKPADPVERVATPIVVPSMTFGGVKLVSWFRKPPFVMDCHLALGLTTFAKDLYELGVRELKFSRIYGYTLVRANGVTKNVLSRHALGLAVDVRSVVDADGREAIVERDYPLEDPLLVRLEAFLNDSGGFRTVLTPKNDPISHHDHFHVEVKLEYGP